MASGAVTGKNGSGEPSKVSFFNSQKRTCPVCEESFKREELLTGGGRLNAKALTDELHRLFQPTEKYGNVHPLIYSIWTCPNCYYSAFREDFSKPKKDTLINLQTKVAMQMRKGVVEGIFDDINFSGYRHLEEGISAYIIGIYSYEHFPKTQAPILKQGICAIRAAWLAVHLHDENPGENYDYLARILYRKAGYFYSRAIELNDIAEQPLTTTAIINYGPGADHNFGLDGAIYLAGMLQFKYGQRSDVDLRIKRLKEAKIMIARLVGSGRASQSKPTVILNHSRDLYGRINEELGTLCGL
ncbi:DUF2225 domain-containing protein [Candidatus Haliotispira prima]|uniref:DUF2225 domain-containing protein n=1 Tax=Candidatus Haliotispira prima TaxID=3034016 RepID=A0ABY8MG73_9SPIO|nr:DUF2225 domain-containing protein [Candidatus Haliotispira prima]